MPLEASYPAAFLVGLLGGVHCFGMCGGIVGALTFSLPQRHPRALFPYLLAYNLGRLSSYVLAGALMGGIGILAANLLAVHQAQRVLKALAGLFMVALGLYLGGWWRGLARVEQAGGILWRRVEPLGRRLFPVRTLPAAFLLGMLWGWLPCGLVYSVLIWAIAAGSALKGALLMASFGLGTLPALLAMGTFSGLVASWVKRPWVRRGAGLVILLLGLYMLAHAL